MSNSGKVNVVGESAVKDWYSSYYAKSGAERNSLLNNPGVLFQILAMEAAVVRALRSIKRDITTFKILDVGCGAGGNTYQFLRVGVKPSNFTGIDIFQERAAVAKEIYPNSKWVVGDASHMAFPDNNFDIVSEFTMFATLPDDSLSSKIAAEMIRVCKPEGFLLLVDWRTTKPLDPSYSALTQTRLRKLFFSSDKVELVGTYRGALIPPLGRFLSKYFPGAYFSISSLFPFLSAQVVYLVRKRRLA